MQEIQSLLKVVLGQSDWEAQQEGRLISSSWQAHDSARPASIKILCKRDRSLFHIMPWGQKVQLSNEKSLWEALSNQDFNLWESGSIE